MPSTRSTGPGRETARRAVTTCRILAEKHIIPDLGARKLDQPTAEDVDRWLKGKSSDLARSTLQRLLSILRRALTRQVARDRLRSNVALHCEVPYGRAGRPSKALTLDQATAVLEAVEGTEMEAYVTVSLLTGAGTGELTALAWSHLDLEGVADADLPRPPSIEVWRSVREGGDTATRLSRRTLRLPSPRELRHSFVSLMSDAAAGGPLAPRRAPQHDRVRVRLPQAASPSPHPGDRGDGPTLPGARQNF